MSRRPNPRVCECGKYGERMIKPGEWICKDCREMAENYSNIANKSIKVGVLDTWDFGVLRLPKGMEIEL
jgi:hypothetical protein